MQNTSAGDQRPTFRQIYNQYFAEECIKEPNPLYASQKALFRVQQMSATGLRIRL